MLKIYTFLLIIAVNLSFANDWEFFSEGFNNNAFYQKTYSIFVNGDDIYLNTQDDGIFKTTKELEDWEYLGLSDELIHSLCIVDEKLFAATIHGLFYKDLNEYQNWREVSNIPDSMEVFYDVIYSNETIYLSSTKGIYISLDKGTTWEKFGLDDYHIRRITLINDTIYAGTNDFIFISYDNGESWEHISEYGGDIREIYYNGKVMYAGTKDGAYYSNDNGKTWESFDFYKYKVSGFTVINDRIIAATDDGIFYSDDEGETWSQYKLGSLSNIVNDVYTIDDKVYACTDGSFYVSSDMGETWQRKLPVNIAEAMYFENSKLYVITEFNDLYIGEFSSDEEKVTWANIEIQPNHRFYKLCFHENKIFAGTWTGLYVSEDGGYNWSLYGIDGWTIYNVQVIEDRLYAGVYGKGTFYTTDKGESWVRVGPEEFHFEKIMKSGDYYIASSRGRGESLYYSANKGESWLGFNNFNWGYALSFLVIDGETYVGTEDGLFKTDDFGHSWDTLVSDNNHVMELIYNNNILYADYSFSTDKGKTWQDMELPIFYFSDLAFGNNYIYASCHLGVFRKELSETVVEEIQRAEAEVLVYPNPTQDQLSLKFHSEVPCSPKLKVINSLGLPILEKEFGYISSGIIQRNVDVSNLRNGTYFIELRCRETVKREKFVISK